MPLAFVFLIKLVFDPSSIITGSHLTVIDTESDDMTSFGMARPTISGLGSGGSPMDRMAALFG